MRRLLPILSAVLLQAAPLVADDVHLANGRVFEDVVAEVVDSRVVIHLAFGEMTVSLDSVDRIDRAESTLTAYSRRRDALRSDPAASAADWVELSRWALAHRHAHGAREAALRAAERDPATEGLDELMRGLEYVYDEDLGRWIPFARSMRLRGFDLVDGEWLSAGQRLARTRAAAEEARAREADRERRLTNAVLAMAAAQLTREPEPRVVYQWPVAVVPSPFIRHHPKGRHSPAPRPDPTAIPISRRQPGSLFPVAGHRGSVAPAAPSGPAASGGSN